MGTPSNLRGKVKVLFEPVSFKLKPRGYESRQSIADVCARVFGRKGHLLSQGGGKVQGPTPRKRGTRYRQNLTELNMLATKEVSNGPYRHLSEK